MTSRLRPTLLLLGLLALAGCLPTQPGITDSPSAPGMLLGLWHGFISPVAFIVSIFSDSVRIYAVPNTGLFYDLGFMLGIGGFSGGIFAGSKKSR